MAYTTLGIDNIQYFPVELQNTEGGIEHAYYLINVLGRLKAEHVSASVFAPMPSGKGDLLSFKVDPAKAVGQRFFRLDIVLPTERYDGR
jgi:hypothetical protein